MILQEYCKEVEEIEQSYNLKEGSVQHLEDKLNTIASRVNKSQNNVMKRLI